MSRKLPESHFGLASYKTNRWTVVPPHGCTLDDVLKRDFWSHVSRKLRPCDILEVHAEDGTWYAELYVRAADKIEAHVVVLNHYELDKAAATDAPAPELGADPYEVKYRGPVARYGVVLRASNEVLRDGFQTREQALQYLAEYRRSMAA